ncbi:30S ribosomal protein S17 [Candidatus Micrarchaeota archaeon]|nr:30S ribosomal protein S17 [Candidatus Micrarchaeota archaeon]
MAEKCDDSKCFMHGDVKVRGERLFGKVVSAKSKKTVVVERSAVKFFPKYAKWARGRSRIAAHNPSCLSAKVGDMVHLAECRKLSKTKAWTVVEIDSSEGASI